MKPITLTRIITLLVSFGLATLGSGFGTVTPCMAMTQLTKLDVISEVKAERKRVNLLDLCDSSGIPDDWKKAMTEIDIGESPAAGTEKVINPLQLKSFIERFLNSQGYDVSKVRIVLPGSISVRRVSVFVPKDKIESIYKEFVTSNAPWNPQDVVIRSVYYSGNVELPKGEMTYEVTPANPRERFIGNVAATIQFVVDGEKETALKVTGKVDVYQNVIHSTHPLKRNVVLSEADVQPERILVSDNPDRLITSVNQIIGRKLLREIAARQPIATTDMDSPCALKRGAPVSIIYENAGLRLTAKGQVREDANIGATIHVVNVMTNRTVTCRVVDATTVQVIP